MTSKDTRNLWSAQTGMRREEEDEAAQGRAGVKRWEGKAEEEG